VLLSEVSIGQSVRICRLDRDRLSPSQKQRLMALGMTPGCRVELVRKAPLGGAIQLNVRGARVCLDNRLAQVIQVEAE